MNRSRVEQILNRFSGKTILIIGDLMLDEFIWGKVRRISPEAPVPVVEVVDETYRLGGSGNVAANIKTMGGVPILIAIHGRDDAARRLAELLNKRKIDSSGVTTADRPTVLKTASIANT